MLYVNKRVIIGSDLRHQARMMGENAPASQLRSLRLQGHNAHRIEGIFIRPSGST